jgi:hypothetical protein
MFGVEPSRQPLGEISFWETILPEDLERVKAEFEKYRQGQEVTVQCRVQGNHRTTRWVQIRTFVMRDSHEIPLRYIGIVNDITARKRRAGSATIAAAGTGTQQAEIPVCFHRFARVSNTPDHDPDQCLSDKTIPGKTTGYGQAIY